MTRSSAVTTGVLPFKYKRAVRARAACLAASTAIVLASAACGPQLRQPGVPEAAVAEERQAQQELAISLFLERVKRLSAVASRVRVHNAELCEKNVTPEFGLLIVTPRAFEEEFHDAARKVLWPGDEVKIVALADGLPAAQAGLQVGDVIVEIKDAPIQEVRERGEHEQVSLMKAVDYWEKRELPLVVKRGEETLDVTLTGVDACKYPVALVSSDAVNAFADGRNVGITSGMIRFVESDDELALVVGHELAHNMLGHLNRRQVNTVAGTILGVLVDIGAAAVGVGTGGMGTRMGSQAGALVFSKQFESESDYLGTYMAARGGYDIAGAPMFWRRMAVEHPSSIGSGGSMLATHPTTPERATALEQTIAEIASKRAEGRPLVPERLEPEPSGERRSSEAEDATGAASGDGLRPAR
jgi:hypothetical protein